MPLTAAAVVLLGGTTTGPARAGTDGGDPSPSAAVTDATAASAAPARRARTWPPTPTDVGVPSGTSLSPYRGPCTITKPRTVIREKTITCDQLHIRTTGVLIERSLVNGSVLVGTQDDYEPTVVSDPEGDDPIRVTVVDSEINTPSGSDFRPISSSHYVVKRSYLHGTESGAECHNACTIKRSYIHGFGEHASGIRILRNGTLKHNTIWCEPNPRSDEDRDGVPDPDGGCSGNLVMYEEFGTPHHNLVKHNYFPAGLFWYSLKFNGEDAGHVRVLDNRFGRPKSGAGLADDWEARPTNAWSGNTIAGGRTARP